MNPPPSSPRSGEDDGAQTVRWLGKALEVGGKFVAPTTVLTGLLFYFGWAYTNAFYRSFGIDPSVLAFATQDYLLRSLRVAFDPLRLTLVAALVLIWAHFVIRRRISRLVKAGRSRAPRVLTGGAAGLGVACLAAGIAAAATLLYPVGWTVGFGLISYALYLSLSYPLPAPDGLDRPADAVAAPRRLSLALALASTVAGMFWTAAVFADRVGRTTAANIAGRLAELPSVTVYSSKPLTIENPAVSVARVSDDEDAYPYRYTGLKFLVRSDEKYFLLPEGWSPSNPVSIILADSDAIRIEVAPGAGGAP